MRWRPLAHDPHDPARRRGDRQADREHVRQAAAEPITRLPSSSASPKRATTALTATRRATMPTLLRAARSYANSSRFRTASATAAARRSARS